MKTAVVGASGYIGSHLLRVLRKEHPDCVGTSFSRPGGDLLAFDLRRPDPAVLQALTRHSTVVVASAMTGIEACEGEDAEAINVGGTLALLRRLGEAGVHVIFLSSDTVFDGATGGYDDDAAMRPIVAYGRQKARVEREIAALCDHTVVRLSKVVGVERGDGTLLDELAAALARGDTIKAAHDLVFCPTLVGDVVTAIGSIQARGMRGVVNVCSPEVWSRYELTRALAAEMGIGAGAVRRVSLAELPFNVKRPANTSMRCRRLAAEVNFEFTPIAECLRRVAASWPESAQSGEA